MRPTFPFLKVHVHSHSLIIIFSTTNTNFFLFLSYTVLIIFHTSSLITFDIHHLWWTQGLPSLFLFLNRVEEESISDDTYARSKGNEQTNRVHSKYWWTMMVTLHRNWIFHFLSFSFLVSRCSLLAARCSFLVVRCSLPRCTVSRSSYSQQNKDSNHKLHFSPTVPYCKNTFHFTTK